MNRSTPGLPVHHHLQSSLRLTSIESVMPSSHLILGHPLLLLPPIPPSIRVFSNESTLRMRWPKYWSFSFSIIPSKEIQEVMNWVIALRKQEPNRSITKNMKRGSVKVRSHDTQLQILFLLPQEFASSSLLFMIPFLSCWAMSLTIPDWFS